jgi:hypothetical protein
VDVGYLLALEIANDQHHQTAVQHWQRIVSMLPPLLTTSYSPLSLRGLCTISRFWAFLLDLYRYKLINSMLNFELLCKTPSGEGGVRVGNKHGERFKVLAAIH